MFQSTHSRGVRLLPRPGHDSMLPVSIHALTRSATENHCSGSRHRPVSIHALTRSATRSYINLACLITFQSTHSRGVRRIYCQQVIEQQIVSIHALTRSATSFTADNISNLEVSIHALTRSATNTTANAQACHSVSIHALTRSATPLRLTSSSGLRFQSTHSRGVRPVSAAHLFPTSLFQSTHSRGVRLKNPMPKPRSGLFQSTHSRGVRRFPVRN